MFEEYLQDASTFLAEAGDQTKLGNPARARTYYRASVFCSASAMEAFVNYVADSFWKANSLERHELAYLNDKALRFTPGEGLAERSEYHPIDAKIRVLLARFLPTFNFADAPWNDFMRFKDLRDSLVHPRAPEDSTPVATYAREVPAGLRAVIVLMNHISRAVFNRPLRKQLLDLMPD